MNILFMASRDWTDPNVCGGDLHTTDYARLLANRGYDVTLIVARYPGSLRQEVLEGVTIVRPAGLFFLALWAAAFYLRRRHQIDVVYEEGMASVRLPFMAPLYVRRPIVSIWYQLNAPIFKEQYSRPVALVLVWVERFLLAIHRRALLLTPSEERKVEIAKTGFPEDRIRVSPPPMLDSRPPAGMGGERQPLVVWLGKIRRYKCPHHAVEALAKVVETVPDARLVVAGRRDDEDYEAELLRIAIRLGIGDRVEIRRNISDAEKWELLGQAKALVVTSPVEGFGIVIVEANACGTPSVTTNGVPAATARDGYNALKVPFGDRQALASALVRLLSDPSLFETYSANARQLAAQFSPEVVGQRLEDVFAAAADRAA